MSRDDIILIIKDGEAAVRSVGNLGNRAILIWNDSCKCQDSHVPSQTHTIQQNGLQSALIDTLQLFGDGNISVNTTQREAVELLICKRTVGLDLMDYDLNGCAVALACRIAKDRLLSLFSKEMELHSPFNAWSFECKTCSLCQEILNGHEDPEKSQTVTLQICSHQFHLVCAKTLKLSPRQKQKCPECRLPMVLPDE